MITTDGPKVVEYNCRFGDPETQVVLPRLDSDILPLFEACCDGRLDSCKTEWGTGACVTVVMASGGYPKDYEKNKTITGIEEAEKTDGLMVFHAGTKTEGGELATNGGRVLNVTALAPDIESGIDKAYDGVAKIHFEDAYYRKDIGRKALKHL